MNMTPYQLEECIGCGYNTIKTYLKRPEFEHITVTKERKYRGSLYHNITKADIKRLKELYLSRRGNIKRRQNYEIQNRTAKA